MKDCKYCIGDMHEEYIYKHPEASHCMYCGRYVGKNDYHATQAPDIETKEDDILGERVESHPAYGQLQFSRQSGGYSNLYGSAIKHQNTVCMTVYPSKKYCSKWSERYFAKHQPLIEVRMSASQFAEAITSMNMGGGVPVTLESVRGRHMPRCQEETIADLANKGLKDKMNNFADKITKGNGRVKAILEKKGTIKVGERKEIGDIISMLMQDLRSNIPFLHTCMTEAYDKTATAAKADIEAFYTGAIMKLGKDALNGKRINLDNDIVDVEAIEEFTATPTSEGRGSEIETLEGSK